MKVASFNVNSLRARLDTLIPWLCNTAVDVLAVQETKVQDADFPRAPFAEIGYRCTFAGQKSYNGVAIFTRDKPTNVKAGFDDEPRDESRLIRADVAGITIVNTYVPQGYLPHSRKFDYKLDWFRRLRDYFEYNFDPADPLLWLGDLNVAPKAIDVYSPETLLGHVCYCTEVSNALQHVMDWGFSDIFRMHCKQAGHYTYWDYRIPNPLRRNAGWRLDHIMATQPLAEKSTNCYIDTGPRAAERPSDHAPVVAEFDL